MEWRCWLLIMLTVETATEAAVAKTPISIEMQKTPGWQKPVYDHAIHQPLTAQEPLVRPGTYSQDLDQEPEVKVGLVFHSSNPKHEPERSYVMIPLHQRLQPGTQPENSSPSCAVS